MSENILYTQNNKGEYVPWGVLTVENNSDIMLLPNGVWHITSNSASNYITRLLTEEDLASKIVVSSRINLKEVILDCLIKNTGKTLSLEDLACEIAQRIIPFQKKNIKCERKGVRLRGNRNKRNTN